MESFEVIIIETGEKKTLDDSSGCLTNYLYDPECWTIYQDGNEHYEEKSNLIMSEDDFLSWENLLEKYKKLGVREKRLNDVFGEDEVNNISHKISYSSIEEMPNDIHIALDKSFGVGVGIISEDGNDVLGYDVHGYSTVGEDRHGYDRGGFDRKGLNRDGIDRDGYNLDGYDQSGIDRNGLDQFWRKIC